MKRVIYLDQNTAGQVRSAQELSSGSGPYWDSLSSKTIKHVTFE